MMRFFQLSYNDKHEFTHAVLHLAAMHVHTSKCMYRMHNLIREHSTGRLFFALFFEFLFLFPLHFCSFCLLTAR